MADYQEPEFARGMRIPFLPEPRAYLHRYVREIAQSILSGDTAPLDGCGEIHEIWAALDYRERLWSWVYLEEGLEPGINRELEDTELEAAIRREAEHLLQDSDAP